MPLTRFGGEEGILMSLGVGAIFGFIAGEFWGVGRFGCGGVWKRMFFIYLLERLIEDFEES